MYTFVYFMYMQVIFDLLYDKAGKNAFAKSMAACYMSC